MNIEFYCPRWGSEQVEWNLFFEKVKQAGYDGVECGVAADADVEELDAIWNLAAKHHRKLIVQHYDTYEADFSKHYDLFCAWLEKVKSYPCEKINSQTGKDFFSFEQNKSLVEAAAAFSEKNGTAVLHETHRNKFLFAAHVTKAGLEQLPNMKITLDASHWVCVAESYLDDQAAAMELAIERTAHVHGRVGYPEGPQVPDPRVAEWELALQKHLNWWDKVVEQKKKTNTLLTIAPEFGPSPYMVHLPETGKPIVDQWEVNIYMMELLRKRYC